MINDLVIRRVTEADSHRVSSMLLGQRQDYLKHFHPFPFDEVTLFSNFSAAKTDRYWMINLGNSFAGFFMLRGLDAGYETPSFGVVIAENYCGFGLSALSLNYSISWCAANRIRKIMLKVHPDNLKAKKIYEGFGFIQSGVDSHNSNIIMHRNLLERSR